MEWGNKNRAIYSNKLRNKYFENILGIYMIPKHIISHELFSQYFEISSSASSGLIWKKLTKNTNTISIGSQAGYLLQSGYYQVKFQKRKYYVHRIIYSLYNKLDLLTDLCIDHIDRNKANNNPTNLKLVTHTENMWNVTKPRSNTSGYVNISKIGMKWKVKIKHNKKEITKIFSVLDDAIKFRNEKVFLLRGVYPID